MYLTPVDPNEYQQILFMVNVQHDCHAAQCRSTVTKYKVIERVQSTNEEQVLQHDSLNRYVLNLAAFHNAHLLRRCLPRETFAPKPIIPTQQRRQTHDTIAAAMHAKMNEKRKVRKAKREAVAAANASSTNDPGPSSAKRQRQYVSIPFHDNIKDSIVIFIHLEIRKQRI